MSQVTIYHNPKCTKSRQTLALIRDQGIEPTVIEYLKTLPDNATIRRLFDSLRRDPEQLIREKESKALGLPKTTDSDELVRRMTEHPQIIQRPIVVHGTRAAIGRPPESVLDIL